MRIFSVRFILLVAVLAMLLLSIPACQGPGPAYDSFVSSADTFMNKTAGSRLEAYVATDATLSAERKQTDLTEIREFKRTIAAAKAERMPAAPSGGPSGSP